MIVNSLLPLVMLLLLLLSFLLLLLPPPLLLLQLLLPLWLILSLGSIRLVGVDFFFFQSADMLSFQYVLLEGTPLLSKAQASSE